MAGNDLATFPDFPAEIRAPAGSLPGVSGFQLHFADHDILTPGDQPDVLVAMNPAALKTNLHDLPKGGTLIVDTDAFTERNLKKAGYDSNPIDDGSLEGWQVHAVQLTSMTVGALKDIEGVTAREAERAKNMFALGLMSWLYGRSTETTKSYLQTKFAKRPEIAAANLKAFDTGYAFGETSEGFAVQYEVKAAPLEPGPLPADHRQRRPLVGAARRVEALAAAALPRRLSDHAGVVDPRGAREAQGVRRAHVPGGGRDRSRRRGARRSLRRLARRHHLGRAGRRAQVGDGRACDRARAAAPDHRRAARRPVDGYADEAGAGRPADGALRAQLRVARAGDRSVLARRLLLRRDRGGARRAHLPHAGLPAFRCVPGERRRAVAGPRHRVAGADPGRVRAGGRRRDVPALQARPGDARAAVGDSRHAGARAPHRRAREGERDRRHLLRRRQPRPDDAAPLSRRSRA